MDRVDSVCVWEGESFTRRRTTIGREEQNQHFLHHSIFEKLRIDDECKNFSNQEASLEKNMRPILQAICNL